MVYTWTMSCCIVGLRIGLIALFLLFFIHFSLFPISHVNIENFLPVFLGSIEVRILELGICMDDELWYGVIENQAHCSYSSLYPFFCLLRLNLCHSFLRNY